jgi:hypothetical protein
LLNSLIDECKCMLKNENLILIEPAREKSVKGMPQFKEVLQAYLKLINGELNCYQFKLDSMLHKPIPVTQPFSANMHSQ